MDELEKGLIDFLRKVSEKRRAQPTHLVKEDYEYIAAEIAEYNGEIKNLIERPFAPHPMFWLLFSVEGLRGAGNGYSSNTLVRVLHAYPRIRWSTNNTWCSFINDPKGNL